MIKVGITLTENDINRIENLKKIMDARSKSDVLSSALSITEHIVNMIKDDCILMVKKKDGSFERLLITGI